MGEPPRTGKSTQEMHRPATVGAPRRARRALTHVGGPIQIDAGPEYQQLLTRALDVSADDPYATDHVHGFHSYPARLHARTAQSLVLSLTRSGQSVLDPFCGSGTVLVEANLSGRTALGIDANPLAVQLSRLKLHKTTEAERSALLEQAQVVAAFAEDRRVAKAGPSKRYPRMIAVQFDPHVLLELDGLFSAIHAVQDNYCRAALSLVASSLLNKVSRRASDTSVAAQPKRLASGFVIRFFGKKTQELVTRLREFADKVPSGMREPSVRLGDARQLPLDAESVNAIVTSPPYPGVYDYVEHHWLRLKWLGFDTRHLENHEIGAKRQALRNSPDAFREAFHQQLQDCLREMARVIVPDGSIALVIADSVIGQRAWYADDAINMLAQRVGLQLAAQAAQDRPHFHAPTTKAFQQRPRCERLLILKRATTNGPASLHRRPETRSRSVGEHRHGSKGRS